MHISKWLGWIDEKGGFLKTRKSSFCMDLITEKCQIKTNSYCQKNNNKERC